MLFYTQLGLVLSLVCLIAVEFISLPWVFIITKIILLFLLAFVVLKAIKFMELKRKEDSDKDLKKVYDSIKLLSDELNELKVDNTKIKDKLSVNSISSVYKK